MSSSQASSSQIGGSSQSSGGSQNTGSISSGSQNVNLDLDTLKGLNYSEKEKLDGSKNFVSWSFKVERQFRKDKLWWELVSPDTSRRVPLTPQQREEKIERAIYIFSVTVKDHIIPIVKKHIDNPAQLWVQLKSRFESAVLGKQLVLREKLSLVHLSEGGSLEEYVRELDYLVMQLADIDFQIDDKELIRIALKGLPASWRPFISSFGTILHQFPSLTFSDLIGHLEAEELQRTLGKTEEALSATVHHLRGGFPRSRGRGRSYGGRSRGRSTSFQTTKRSDSCTFCGFSGHWETDCLKKLESQIKDLQAKHAGIKSELRKGKHQALIAKTV